MRVHGPLDAAQPQSGGKHAGAETIKKCEVKNRSMLFFFLLDVYQVWPI